MTSVYGIGRVTAQRICDETGIARTTKVHELSEEDADRIRSQVASIPVEGDLRREISMNIKRLMGYGVATAGCGIEGVAGTRTANLHQCANP